jgi:hypothetical protein
MGFLKLFGVGVVAGVFSVLATGCAGTDPATDASPQGEEQSAASACTSWPAICQKVSFTDINGQCCSCAARGVTHGELHNDNRSTPNIYYCR